MKTSCTFFLSLFLVTGASKEAAAQVRGGLTAGASASTAERTALADEPPADRPSDAESQWAERESKLNESSTLTGGVGLLHTQHAQGGASGQFRVDFETELFSAGFLCTPEFPCRDPRNSNALLQSDTTDHFGGRLRLSAQLTRWLDTYLATGALANSNPANRPSLLQVLGDSTLGAKAHGAVSKVFHVGGAVELWLVNGTGAVGLDGAGTSAKFRGLATADLRGAEKRIPLRFSTNLTYVLDNSGEVVSSTETARGTAITRIERFGLNIHRVDHFDVHFGAEVFAAKEMVRPFIEYSLLVPVNRQDYECRPSNPSSDKCLATDPLFPSTLTLGSRFYPWKKGFNLLAGLDIGISGVGSFIEEVRPTPPWMLYLGAGWAFDTHDKPPRERVVYTAGREPLGRRIRGFVHEENRAGGVSGAIVSWDNHPELTSLSTGADGRFTTHHLSAGRYVFAVQADGYKPGSCFTTLVDPGTSAPPGAPSNPSPVEGGEVQLDCALSPLPRVGAIVGTVKDLDTGLVVNGAPVKVVDVAKREHSASSDAQGGFRFEALTPGEATITVDADGYLVNSQHLEVRARQDNSIEMWLKKQPK
ncbi:MAG TPA: carboxypeptidase-like regulatory domain-containing protein, partial [Labilithrix sp.]|nr:carboxypeptidase-like regulatory domain-containing protein [Labilithrix sp.]